MITFDLNCSNGHQFEGWFASSADFDAQNYTAVPFNQQVQARSIVKGYFLNRQSVADKNSSLKDVKKFIYILTAVFNFATAILPIIKFQKLPEARIN